MKISVGQFVGLLLIAAVVYYFISPWWGEQDQGSWINRFNNSIIEDGRAEGSSRNKEEKPYDPSGWN